MDICIIVTLALSIIVVTAYITARICNHEFESEWLIIKLKTNVVEPEDIYVCKECHLHENNNWRYCKNCGRRMRNGVVAREWYSDDIEL